MRYRYRYRYSVFSHVCIVLNTCVAYVQEPPPHTVERALFTHMQLCFWCKTCRTTSEVFTCTLGLQYNVVGLPVLRMRACSVSVTRILMLKTAAIIASFPKIYAITQYIIVP